MPCALDRKTLIAKMKATAKRLGKRYVKRAEFHRATGVSGYFVSKHFNSYNELLRAAGLTVHRDNQRVPEDDLLRAMGEVFRQANGLVTQTRFGRLCRYSLLTYLHRWRSWTNTLQAFRQWQSRHDPDFPYADQIDGFRTRGGRSRGRPAWAPLGGRRYGEPLNFRGLLHEPLNEQGVVFLFATLAIELGFLIESLTTEFPDCEAKRRVGKAWERVRIEFEYQSRSFRDHGHDPKACDLIVCWEHNWPDCPIEVLELKTAVDSRLDIRAKPTLPAGIGKTA